MVQYFVEMPPDLSEEMFLFVEQMCDVRIAPLSVDGHVLHANQRNDIERQSEEGGLHDNHLVFLLCGGLHKNIRSVAIDEKPAC